jgi:hypothetical protein
MDFSFLGGNYRARNYYEQIVVRFLQTNRSIFSPFLCRRRALRPFPPSFLLRRPYSSASLDEAPEVL